MEPRPRGRDPADAAASSASASSPTARSAAASSPARSSSSTISPRTTTAATSPRFQGENFEKNLELVERDRGDRRREKGCTPAQLALAWVLAQGDDIVPIPGTKRRNYLEENVAALDVQLTADDLAHLDEIMPRDAAAGARYPEAMMRAVNQ